MYKRFLAGCAMAALSLSAGAAAAQDFKVSIKGDVTFQAVFASQDKDANTRGVDFRNRFRLWINPEATGLDGALTYGARVRLLEANSDSTGAYDFMYTYVQGAFGSVLAGDIDTYSDSFDGVGGSLAIRPNDFQAKDDVALSFVKKSQDTAYTTSSAKKLEAWRDSAIEVGTSNTAGDYYTPAVRYVSPYISGLQLAVQYTPSSGHQGWSFNRAKTGVEFLDAVELGLLFNSKDKTIADKFGDAVLQASFDYQHAQNGYTGFKDWNVYQGGLTVGYKTFLVGGAVQYFGKSGLNNLDASKENRYSYNVGAQYGYDAFTFGLGYNYAQKDVDFSDTGSVSSNAGKKTSSELVTGVRYTVSKGLNVYGEYAYVQNKNTLVGVKDTANVVTLSTKLSF